MSSTTAITDALVNQLKPWLGAENVRKDDYEILARRRPWAAIVSLESGDVTPHQFGRYRRGWTFRVALFIPARAAGDMPAARMTEAVDKTVDGVLSDITLGGTVDRVDRISVAFTPGTSLDIGGIHWYSVNVHVQCSVF